MLIDLVGKVFDWLHRQFLKSCSLGLAEGKTSRPFFPYEGCIFRNVYLLPYISSLQDSPFLVFTTPEVSNLTKAFPQPLAINSSHICSVFNQRRSLGQCLPFAGEEGKDTPATLGFLMMRTDMLLLRTGGTLPAGQSVWPSLSLNAKETPLMVSSLW